MNTPVPIIQGSRFSIPVRLKNPITGRPYDLTAVTAITTCFTNQDGSELMLALGTGITVTGNPLLGELAVAGTAAQSTLLEATDVLALELSLTDPSSADPFKVLVPMAYQVLASLC